MVVADDVFNHLGLWWVSGGFVIYYKIRHDRVSFYMRNDMSIRDTSGMKWSTRARKMKCSTQNNYALPSRFTFSWICQLLLSSNKSIFQYILSHVKLSQLNIKNNTKVKIKDIMNLCNTFFSLLCFLSMYPSSNQTSSFRWYKNGWFVTENT